MIQGISLSFLLLMIACSEDSVRSNGVLSESENDKIREYISLRTEQKQSVDIKSKFGTNLKGTKLTGANLSGSDLSGVDFSGAEIARVDFSGCNLNNVDFRGATIQESDFSGVVFNGFAAENVDFQASIFNKSKRIQ